MKSFGLGFLSIAAMVFLISAVCVGQMPLNRDLDRTAILEDNVQLMMQLVTGFPDWINRWEYYCGTGRELMTRNVCLRSRMSMAMDSRMCCRKISMPEHRGTISPAYPETAKPLAK